MRNLYEILEVPIDASQELIRASYQRLIVISERDDLSQQNLNIHAVEMAYNVLGNADNRWEYDENLRQEILKLPFPYTNYEYVSPSASFSDVGASHYFSDSDVSESNTSMNSIAMDNLGNDCGSDSCEDEFSLEKLTRAITEGCDRYTRYHQSNRQSLMNNRRYFNGYLSFFRHGSVGLQNAADFKMQMNTMDSLNNAVKEIVAFLTSELRAYHTHSLASYILDEVKILLEQMGKCGLHTDDTGHYTERDWIWVSELNIVDNYPWQRR
jgi:curved DNA-binding protein CbpA